MVPNDAERRQPLGKIFQSGTHLSSSEGKSGGVNGDPAPKKPEAPPPKPPGPMTGPSRSAACLMIGGWGCDVTPSPRLRLWNDSGAIFGGIWAGDDHTGKISRNWRLSASWGT